MLKNKAAILQGALDAMQDLLRVLDLDQRVVLINKSFRDTVGDQIGRKCHEMFGLSNSCMNCISKKALAIGAPQQKNRRYNQQIFSVTASPLYAEDGKAIGTVEVLRDVTEQYMQQDALRVQNKKLLREANLAARMQRSLFLAQGTPDSRVKMHSRYLPASSLGGDMFGFLSQKDGKLGFYIADVSGHGMAAAMITLLLANVMRGTRASSAVQVLHKAREAFLSMVKDEQLYVSMFAAILDPDTGELRWANAGLNAIPLLQNGDTIERLYAPAYPLCNWEEEILYREHNSKIEKGGRLFLYTDGLLDERSTTWQSEEELEENMHQYAGDDFLMELERKVLGNHEDDVCMLQITLAGAGESEQEVNKS